MIEIGTYKLFYNPLKREETDSHDEQNRKHVEHVAKVVAYLNEQSEAYGQLEKKGLGQSKESRLSISEENIYGAIIFSACSGFQRFLQEQEKPDFIRSIEKPSGAQYMILAGFVSSPHQSTADYGSGALLSDAFWRVSHGVNVGKVLTEEEKEARIAMNDRVFQKLSEDLRKFKERFSDVVIELEEKQLGSIFLRVTTEENTENGLNSYELSSILRRLSNDKENVEAILEGPPLYPSEVERLRTPRDDGSKQAPVRKPKNLQL